MTANSRKLQWRKDDIDVGQRTAAHQSKGAIKTIMQHLQDHAQFWRHHNIAGSRREFEQSAVDIEQQRCLIHVRHNPGWSGQHLAR